MAGRPFRIRLRFLREHRNLWFWWVSVTLTFLSFQHICVRRCCPTAQPHPQAVAKKHSAPRIYWDPTSLSTGDLLVRSTLRADSERKKALRYHHRDLYLLSVHALQYSLPLFGLLSVFSLVFYGSVLGSTLLTGQSD
jgi:hypothetical protein